ncbi:MAG: type II toxin-antitoxin system death-on-curing family toxin [Pseudomonadota bacterium]
MTDQTADSLLILPSRDVILEAHRASVTHFGGADGVRNEGGFDSALARPLNIIAYEGDSASVYRLAAAVGAGISQNHPFVDGNKRTAILASIVTLWVNGYVLDVSEREMTDKVLALASNKLTEDELCAWLEANSIEREGRLA